MTVVALATQIRMTCRFRDSPRDWRDSRSIEVTMAGAAGSRTDIYYKVQGESLAPADTEVSECP